MPYQNNHRHEVVNRFIRAQMLKVIEQGIAKQMKNKQGKGKAKMQAQENSAGTSSTFSDSGKSSDPGYLSFTWTDKTSGGGVMPYELTQDLKDLGVYDLMVPNAYYGWHVTQEALLREPLLDAIVRKHKEHFVFNPKLQAFFIKNPNERY